MLSVAFSYCLLRVIMLHVVMLSVMVPTEGTSKNVKRTIRNVIIIIVLVLTTLQHSKKTFLLIKTQSLGLK
jgi:hypothetical protein